MNRIMEAADSQTPIALNDFPSNYRFLIYLKNATSPFSTSICCAMHSSRSREGTQHHTYPS